MTQPTPDDARVWTFHLLGWATRKIAAEVDISQSTVTRIIQRIQGDPSHPVHAQDPDKTAAFAAMVTPPNGFRIGTATAPQPAITATVPQPQLPPDPPPLPATMLQPVNIPDAEPPAKPPVRDKPPADRKPPPPPPPTASASSGRGPVTVAVIALLIAFASLCFAGVAWKTAHNITPTPGPQGQQGPAGKTGPPAQNRVRLCIRFDNVTGDISSVYGTKTDCGPNRLLIKVP